MKEIYTVISAPCDRILLKILSKILIDCKKRSNQNHASQYRYVIFVFASNNFHKTKREKK